MNTTQTHRIANLDAPVGNGPAQVNDKGYMLQVTVNRDGHFTVLNERSGKSEEYTAK